MKDSVQRDIDNAERAIGRILRDLEVLHPSYSVTSLGLKTIETTHIESTHMIVRAASRRTTRPRNCRA